MRLVASIFNSSEFKKKIHDAHLNLSDHNIFSEIPADDQLTLFDFFADPDTGFRCSGKHERVKAALLSDEEVTPDWTDFGFKFGPECAIMNNRFKFIQQLSSKELEVISSVDPKTQSVEKLSLKAGSSSTLLAFKYWWIIRGIETPFRGMLPSNSPVKMAIKTLWGNIGGGDMLHLSDFQHRLAHELDIDPIHINTALSLIGKRMSKADDNE